MATNWRRLPPKLLLCLAPIFATMAKGAPQTAATGQTVETRDLAGVWNLSATPAMRKYIFDRWSAEEPALTPWGEAELKKSKPSFGAEGADNTLQTTNDPVLAKCQPPGTPRIYMHPFPMQIVQTPNEVIMLFEYDHTVRHIDLNRGHSEDPDPTYGGDSVGHWDGDTLVVDTIALGDQTWLDREGHRHSDQFHVIERMQRTGHDKLQIDITMEDPKALAKPWTSTLYFTLHPNWQIMEQDCTDNADFVNFEK
jgi:hypothetical protein